MDKMDESKPCIRRPDELRREEPIISSLGGSKGAF
jgi:hypothetical protein